MDEESKLVLVLTKFPVEGKSLYSFKNPEDDKRVVMFITENLLTNLKVGETVIVMYNRSTRSGRIVGYSNNRKD